MRFQKAEPLTVRGRINMQSALASDAPRRPRWAFAAGIAAVLFGVLTVLTGGVALFGGPSFAAPFGNIVKFVLWSNFMSGFFYVLAGIGLFLWRRWAALLSAAIAVAGIIVFAVFGWHVSSGGDYEMRTAIAMTFRTSFWVAIAIASCRGLGCFRTVPLIKRR